MGMTDRDRKVLAIVLVLLVFGGYWFLVIGKKRSAIKTAEADQVAAQANLETAKNAEAAALKVAKVKPVAYSRLLRLGKAIPADEDFQSLLVQVNNITVDSGVSFQTLSASTSSTPAADGATGTTTCDASSATGSTDATAAAASPATGESGASGATGSTAQTWVGKDRDKAEGAVSASDTANAQSDAASKAIECANSPTLTDIAAKAAGLEAEAYTLTFVGSFYDLKKVYNGLLDMVTVNNGRVGVSGRLLDINSIAMSVQEFPMLTANVQMTGYKLPVASASNGTELNSTATTPSASATDAANTANTAASAPAQ